MSNLKLGDIVARKSYGFDIFFKVVDIKPSNNGDNIICLKGVCYRIEADAPESDLLLQTDQRISEHFTRMRMTVEKKCRGIQIPSNGGQLKKALFRNTSKDNAHKFFKPGKVLHLDGDNDYLATCESEYKKYGIEVYGKYIPEKDQPEAIKELLSQYDPDILVLTGHDGVIKGDSSYTNIDSYRNSKFFINSVKEARKYNNNLDSLVIFAGACQSMYWEIIKAGANYASSPGRVLIHALDPVLVCQKVAYSGIDSVINPSDVINNTITGSKGIGGIQTRGKYREGYPAEAHI